MLNGDMGRYRNQDMLRTSEARRIGRDAAKKHAERRNAKLRGALTSIATLVALPVHR